MRIVMCVSMSPRMVAQRGGDSMGRLFFEYGDGLYYLSEGVATDVVGDRKGGPMRSTRRPP